MSPYPYHAIVVTSKGTSMRLPLIDDAVKAAKIAWKWVSPTTSVKIVPVRSEEAHRYLAEDRRQLPLPIPRSDEPLLV